jgi:Domain of unknown function (DUF4268)
MGKVKLGSLRSMDVRAYWPNEASDFTPWLAQEENIGKLGEAIGLELEVEHTEVSAGPYSVDILARGSTDGDYVVIENQLAKTDHDHLGKSLTYAAVLGATTVVWIAPEFTDEHQKALEWLNDNSSENIRLFGVQVELWTIDDSAPAVRFNVVSRPNEAVRRVSTAKGGPLSDSRRLQLEWWTAFREALLSRRAVPSAQTPRPQYWYNVALGRTGFVLSATANTYDKKIGVRVYLTSRFGGNMALQQLQESRDAIEAEFGRALEWNPNPDAADKVIAAVRDADLARKDKWPEYLDWMVDTTVRLRKVFGPRIKALDLSSPEAADEET